MHEATADRFHRVMKHRRRRVGFLKNALRLAKALVDIAPSQTVLQQKISAALFMQNRRAWRQRFKSIENRRQRLILDVNLFQRALRRTQIFCNNHGNEIAVEAHFVDGDKILVVGNFEMLVRRELESGVYTVQMLPIHDTQDAGHFQSFAGIDAHYPGVGIRAQQTCAVRRVRQIRQILDVLRLAGDFVAKIDPRNGNYSFRVLTYWIDYLRIHRLFPTSPFEERGIEGDLFELWKRRNLHWPLFFKEGNFNKSPAQQYLASISFVRRIPCWAIENSCPSERPTLTFRGAFGYKS